MPRYVIIMRVSLCVGLYLVLLVACTTTFAKEWPVKHITLPPGAAMSQLPPFFANDPNMVSSEDVHHGLWFSCFDCPGGWDAVQAQLESCLTPLGYAYNDFETKDIAPPQADPKGVVRVYASPSGKVKVALMNLHACARYGAGFDGGGRFLIMVTLDPEPAS
jgi:hypothetical protein